MMARLRFAGTVLIAQQAETIAELQQAAEADQAAMVQQGETITKLTQELTASQSRIAELEAAQKDARYFEAQRDAQKVVIEKCRVALESVMCGPIEPIYGTIPMWRVKETLAAITSLTEGGWLKRKKDSAMDIVEEMRGFEIDHEPEGWPGVRMIQISALCDEIDRLRKAGREAADVLRQEATILRDCHTLDGKWDGTEPEVQAAYDKQMSLADALDPPNAGVTGLAPKGNKS